MIAELIILRFLSIGVIFNTLGVIGLLRFPDVYTRMHATTKATTFGSVFTTLAVIVYPVSLYLSHDRSPVHCPRSSRPYCRTCPCFHECGRFPCRRQGCTPERDPAGAGSCRPVEGGRTMIETIIHVLVIAGLIVSAILVFHFKDLLAAALAVRPLQFPDIA